MLQDQYIPVASEAQEQDRNGRAGNPTGPRDNILAVAGKFFPRSDILKLDGFMKNDVDPDCPQSERMPEVRSQFHIAIPGEMRP